MGGGGSKSAPTVIEEEPPAGSDESSIIYPSRGGKPRLDGISRSLANECKGCQLQVVSGISSSSVKISREYGFVSANKCRAYASDLKRVREQKMSWQDFLNNLQAGKYLRFLDNGYCEQVELPSEEAQKVTRVEEFDEGKLRSVRIQQMSSGGFSSDTKAKFTPSIPFKVRFTAGGSTKEITVKTMTLYHPCPLRLEGIQPDAVLSLNDPSFDTPDYVVLVPLVGRNVPGNSVEFLQKIMSQVATVSQPDPASGQYVGRDIPTGANWTLSKVFTVQPSGDGNFDVMNGFYEWKGMPPLERRRRDGPGTITYSWAESGTPAPRYIMMDTPVVCNPGDLANVTSLLPVTPALDAIHAVLYDDNPFQRGIVHKQGPPGASCSTKETFTVNQLQSAPADLQGAYAIGESYLGGGSQEEEACDAWTLWAQASAGKGFTVQQITTLIFNSMVFLAMCVGAYLAFNAVLRYYDVQYSKLSETVGKITAVFAKNLSQKAAAIRQNISTNLSGLPGPGGLLALKSGNVSQGNLTAVPGIPSVPPPPTALTAPPPSPAAPPGSVAARRAELEAKTKDKLPLTPENEAMRLGTTPDVVTGRGRTLKHGRGHGGLTRRGVR